MHGRRTQLMEPRHGHEIAARALLFLPVLRDQCQSLRFERFNALSQLGALRLVAARVVTIACCCHVSPTDLGVA